MTQLGYFLFCEIGLQIQSNTLQATKEHKLQTNKGIDP